MSQRTWSGGDPTDPNKWGTAANWLEGAVPIDNDDVTIAAEAESILDDLNQATLKLDSFHVEEGFKGDIGVLGTPLRFKLAVDDLVYAGSGVAWIDVVPDTGDLSPRILRCGQGRTGVFGLTLIGTAFKKITLSGPGTLGVGVNPGDTSTRLDTLDVSGAGSVELGPSVAKITAGSTDVTVSHASASVTADCDVNEVEAVAGTFRQRTGIWTLANVHEATAYASGSGTYVMTNVDAQGKVFNNENNTARTFTDIEIENGGTWHDPAGTGVYTNSIEFPFGLDRCILDFGRDRKAKIEDIP